MRTPVESRFVVFGRSVHRTARCGIATALVACCFTGPAAVQASAASGEARGTIGQAALDRIAGRAASLERLHSLIVAHRGREVLARAFRGPALETPVNIKSVAKSVISALAGIAIDRGLIDGADRPIVPLLGGMVPEAASPRLREVTLGHLLSMRSGLERTSGANYGRWVASDDWVAYALSRPFVAAPGGRMLYSTGNTHVVSALLTRVAGRSTYALARDWLARPLGIDLARWDRDPQGIYFGGNNMLMSPRDLLRFGELYRNGGVRDGRRILSEDWIRASWTPYAVSPWSGHAYGYGWFITERCGAAAYYARGFGGQFVHVVPSLALTVVITSDATERTRVGGYLSALRSLIDDDIVPAAKAAETDDDGERACSA